MSEQTSKTVDNSDEAERRRQIEFYESYIPKAEASDAASAFLDVLNERSQNLRYMTIFCGAVFTFTTAFFVAQPSITASIPQIIAIGLIISSVLSLLATFAFGLAVFIVSNAKFGLARAKYDVIVSFLLNQRRTEFDNSVRAHLDDADRATPLTLLGFILIVGALVLAFYVFISFVVGTW